MIDQEMSDVEEIEIASIAGPESSYIRLISQDGFEFYIRRRFTLISLTITNMLNVPYAVSDENDPSDVNLKDIDSAALNRACEYMVYFDRYRDLWYQIPDFPIEKELCVELLLCSNFMQC